MSVIVKHLLLPIPINKQFTKVTKSFSVLVHFLKNLVISFHFVYFEYFSIKRIFSKFDLTFNTFALNYPIFYYCLLFVLNFQIFLNIFVFWVELHSFSLFSTLFCTVLYVVLVSNSVLCSSIG